jgi:hypothetical protein
MTPSSAAMTSSASVDAADAGQHVLDEVDMAGDIDDADALARAASGARQVDPGKAQIDGHAARLFFFEPVRIDAGQARTSVDLPWSTWPAVPMTRMEGRD